MRDDHLLQDLEPLPYAQDTLSTLKDHGITTYTQLFALLRDEAADPEIRTHSCYALLRLNKIIDKRRAASPLLVTLKSPNEDVRAEAAHALGDLESRQAVLPLMELAGDKKQPESVRTRAIQGLWSIADERALDLFRRIMFDASDDVEARCNAIESYFGTPFPHSDILTLLSDPLPDIRFWASFRFEVNSDDIAPALKALDRIVAFDHTVPAHFGWHVDREAMLHLGKIYYQQIVGVPENEEGLDSFAPVGMVLISPAPEYGTFLYQFRKWKEDFSYTTAPTAPITLNVDPDWLADKIEAQWPDIALNPLQPRPQAYLLDWHLQIGDEHLIGALHRDHYAVVLTGSEELAYQFAEWYRAIIAPDQPLFFYEWADEGIELTSGITASQLNTQIEQRDAKRRQPPP